MSVEENKAIIRRFYESIGDERWIRRIREAENREAETEKLLSTFFSEYYAPNCFMHATDGDKSLEEDIRETAQYFVAFPDLKADVEDIIAEGDKVVARWTMRGTHENAIRDIPATGKKVTVNGVTIKRMANGKVVEEWALINMLNLLQQIEAIPPK
jgi:steroid delta-isomerase-like uncharacterized protein